MLKLILILTAAFLIFIEIAMVRYRRGLIPAIDVLGLAGYALIIIGGVVFTAAKI